METTPKDGLSGAMACIRGLVSLAKSVDDLRDSLDSVCSKRNEGDTVKNPTELEIAAEYKREFPLCHLSGHERAFLAMIHVARSHGVGFGWIRQAVGLAWKVADPIGYIDDERVIALHTPPRPRRFVCSCGAISRPRVYPFTCTCGAIATGAAGRGLRATQEDTVSIYVIRRSNGKKWYIDARTGAGTARSNRHGKAKRFASRWAAWAYVSTCGVPENWVPVKPVFGGRARKVSRG